MLLCLDLNAQLARSVWTWVLSWEHSSLDISSMDIVLFFLFFLKNKRDSSSPVFLGKPFVECSGATCDSLGIYIVLIIDWYPIGLFNIYLVNEEFCRISPRDDSQCIMVFTLDLRMRRTQPILVTSSLLFSSSRRGPSTFFQLLNRDLCVSFWLFVQLMRGNILLIF